MKTQSRRGVRGSFEARELGSGSWQLRSGQAAGAGGGAEIYLVGAEPGAATMLDSVFSAVDFEWVDGGVLVTLTSAGERRVVRTRAALIHEPLRQLYDGLPLASLDDAARRFWRRVFWLVRLPGGRYLLRLVARAARRPQ